MPPPPIRDAAAGVVLADPDGRVLIGLRGATAIGSYTWNLPGGEISDGETAADTALRELREQTGFLGEITLRKVAEKVVRHTDANRNIRETTFTTFLATVDHDFAPQPDADTAKKNAKFEWKRPDAPDFPPLSNLHPGFRGAFEDIVQAIPATHPLALPTREGLDEPASGHMRGHHGSAYHLNPDARAPVFSGGGIDNFGAGFYLAVGENSHNIAGGYIKDRQSSPFGTWLYTIDMPDSDRLVRAETPPSPEMQARILDALSEERMPTGGRVTLDFKERRNFLEVYDALKERFGKEKTNEILLKAGVKGIHAEGAGVVCAFDPNDLVVVDVQMVTPPAVDVQKAVRADLLRASNRDNVLNDTEYAIYRHNAENFIKGAEAYAAQLPRYQPSAPAPHADINITKQDIASALSALKVDGYASVLPTLPESDIAVQMLRDFNKSNGKAASLQPADFDPAAHIDANYAQARPLLVNALGKKFVEQWETGQRATFLNEHASEKALTMDIGRLGVTSVIDAAMKPRTHMFAEGDPTSLLDPYLRYDALNTALRQFPEEASLPKNQQRLLSLAQAALKHDRGDFALGIAPHIADAQKREMLIGSVTVQSIHAGKNAAKSSDYIKSFSETLQRFPEAVASPQGQSQLASLGHLAWEQGYSELAVRIVPHIADPAQRADFVHFIANQIEGKIDGAVKALSPEDFAAHYRQHLEATEKIRLPNDIPPYVAEMYRQLHPDADVSAVRAEMTKGWARKEVPVVHAEHSAPMPDSLNRLTESGRLGGSTGAYLVLDEEGNRFVTKRGATPEHVEAEYQANRVYAAVGAAVPEAALLHDHEGKPVMVMRFVEGELWNKHCPEPTASAVYNPTSGPEQYALKHRVGDHFVLDALLGNYDVVANGENIIVTPNRETVRIDVGGVFNHRAQGEQKEWSADHVNDIDTLRDKQYAASHEVYSRVSNRRIGQQIIDIRDHLPEIEKVLPPDKFAIFEQRLAVLENRYERSINEARTADTPEFKPAMRYLSDEKPAQDTTSPRSNDVHGHAGNKTSPQPSESARPLASSEPVHVGAPVTQATHATSTPDAPSHHDSPMKGAPETATTAALANHGMKGIGAAGLANRMNALKDGHQMSTGEKVLNGLAIAADTVDTFSDTNLGKKFGVVGNALGVVADTYRGAKEGGIKGAVQEGAASMVNTGISLAVFLDQGKNLVGKGRALGGLAGFAGKSALLASAATVVGDTKDYLTGKKELSTDNVAGTALDAAVNFDPLKAVTGLANATKLVGIDTGIQNISVATIVDRAMGGKGENISDIKNETQAIYKQEQERFKAGELDGSLRPKADGDDPNKPKMTDYKHLAAIKERLAKHLPDGKIDGHDIRTEFNKIDFTKPENYMAYKNAMNKAMLEQEKIKEQNSSWVPSWLRSGDSMNKYNDAQSEINILSAAEKEFGMFEQKTLAYKQEEQKRTAQEQAEREKQRNQNAPHPVNGGQDLPIKAPITGTTGPAQTTAATR